MKNSWNEKLRFNLAPNQVFLFWGTAILLVAAIMRLIFLQDVPPGLSQDEVLNADIVNFIRGGYHAIFFREGYGHEPLYHYWSVPFQILFGDNVLSIRLPAVYLGIFLVALAMRWSRREFGRLVAIITGVGLAISWWPIIFSRIGLRPIMEPVILLVFALFWSRRPWIAGLFLGLSVYSYTGARVVYLWPVLLFLYWLLHRRKDGDNGSMILGRRVPKEVSSALIVLFTALLVSIPLFLTLQSDPSLQQRVDQLSGPLDALAKGDFQPIISTTLATLGVFSFQGDPRWTYTIPGNPLFNPMTAFLFYGGLVLAIVRFRTPAYAFALMWLFVGLIPSAITPQAPSTVRLIGAMPVVYLMPALFIGWVWERIKGISENNPDSRGRRWSKALRITIPLLLIPLLLVNVIQTYREGFLTWSQALDTRIKYQSVFLDIARHIDENPGAEFVIAEGFYRPITNSALIRDLGNTVEPRWVQTGDEVAGALVFPQGPEATKLLYIPEYAPPDSGLFAAAGMETTPIFRSENIPSFAVYSLGEPAPNNGVEEVTYGGILTLVGYNIIPSADQNSLQLVTNWRVEKLLPDDLSTFVHLLDGEGKLLSQHDGLDAAPGTLRPGDQILQRHVLILPTPIQPNSKLELGLYTRGDGVRLNIEDGSPDIINSTNLSFPNFLETEP